MAWVARHRRNTIKSVSCRAQEVQRKRRGPVRSLQTTRQENVAKGEGRGTQGGNRRADDAIDSDSALRYLEVRLDALDKLLVRQLGAGIAQED